MRMRIDQSGQNQFISSLYYVDLIVVLAKEGIDFGFVICHSPDPAAVDTESLISLNTVFGINLSIFYQNCHENTTDVSFLLHDIILFGISASPAR